MKEKRIKGPTHQEKHLVLGRVLKLLFLLLDNHFGVPIVRIAKEVGCSKRTVYKYLEALKKTGLTIFNDRSQGGPGRWRLSAPPTHYKRRLGIAERKVV